MKKRINIILLLLNILPLALTIIFIFLAIKNYPSMGKYIIMATFLGIISIAILIGTITGLIMSKKEKQILENGVIITGRVCSAQLIFANYICPNLSESGVVVEYNNKYPCADTQYRLGFEFETENGKTISKTAFLAPYVTKQELSYLISKDTVKLKAYKNNIAFTSEMLANELKDMPQKLPVVAKDNGKVYIKYGIHSLSLTKSKKFKNAYYTTTENYNLFVSKMRGIKSDFGGEPANTNYLCSVKFKFNFDGKNFEKLKFVSIRDFSRIQQLQLEGKYLPVIIKNNDAYIDFDKLPIA